MESNASANESSAGKTCPYYEFNMLETVISSTAYISIIIASLIGNCLIICIVFSNHRMRTVTHYFIINMAVADLLITVFGMPVSASVQILSTDLIPHGGLGGKIFCKMLEYTQDVSVSCSILTLVAVATDRFCATLFPFKRVVTLTRAKWIMVMIWVISLIFPVPLLLVININTWDIGQFYCKEDWSVFGEFSKELERGYTSLLFIIHYAFPLFVMAILYGAIIRKVWKRKIPGQATIRGQQMQNRAKKNVLKMFITVVLSFAICWLPYHVGFFAHAVVPCGISANVWFFSSFMRHANSSITPWIYVVFSRDYRKGIKNILFKCRCRENSRQTIWERSTRNFAEPVETNSVALKSYTNIQLEL